MKLLHTERLTLRPWREDDAPTLFALGSEPSIGLNAGWSPIRDIENARDVIESVLSNDFTYAMTLRESDELVGCIALKPVAESVLSLVHKGQIAGLETDELDNLDQTREIGYWLGVPYQGRGLMQEAAEAIPRYAFEGLSAPGVWALHEASNRKSERVMEKLGMDGVGMLSHVHMSLLPGEVFWDEHVHFIGRSRWMKNNRIS